MTFPADGASDRARMHADEVSTDVSLVRRLIAEQFPQWANLHVHPVRSTGTDNAIYRLGRNMAVRLPRRPAAATQVEKEQEWLPRLAPKLPFAIPIPLAKGKPAGGYPWAWSVCRWLVGESPEPDGLADPVGLANDLARFILALRAVDPAGGPVPGLHNFGRGEPLTRRDRITRRSIAALKDEIDVGAVTAAWDSDVAAPPWTGAPVWIHGDLSSANILALEGRLSGVIDFGGLGVGDPAGELFVAWNLFPPEARRAFRAALHADDASWARGRGWALAIALVAMPYYRDTNPPLVERARRVVDAVLADHKANGLPASG
jgi:aminoglycoside phosphotransferase (APT) family kinase protein